MHKVPSSVRALILLAHGSKSADWRVPFDQLEAEALHRWPHGPIALAFFEHASPSLEEAVDRLYLQGVEDFQVEPLLLAPGFHVQEDLPSRLEALRLHWPRIRLKAAPVLMDDPFIREAVLERATRNHGGEARWQPTPPEVPVSRSLEAKIQEAQAILIQAVEAGASPAFSTSLGVEDQVVLDLIVQSGLPIEVFTLDTGRLHPETYELLARTEAFYRKRIQVYFPEQQAVEAFVRINGINGFYESRSQRQSCCEIRKLEPLRRALAGKTAWITGLRRGQSAGRSEVTGLAFDEQWGLLKANPLVSWTEDDVWSYARSHALPTNLLHEQGYPSIGCAPCTRAVAPGEDIRAGRWWWENDEKKECGLHVRSE